MQKKVDKTTYCLLAFFLGVFGVHKFYAGKTGQGVMYILFCWTGIPGILTLVDLIVGLCRQADGAGQIEV